MRTRLPTFRSVTHPRIALGQARLTLEFFSNELPEKKLQLVSMGILSILLSHASGSHIHPPLEDRRLYRSTTSHEHPLLAYVCASSAATCAMACLLRTTGAMLHMSATDPHTPV